MSYQPFKGEANRVVSFLTKISLFNKNITNKNDTQPTLLHLSSEESRSNAAIVTDKFCKDTLLLNQSCKIKDYGTFPQQK